MKTPGYIQPASGGGVRTVRSARTCRRRSGAPVLSATWAARRRPRGALADTNNSSRGLRGPADPEAAASDGPPDDEQTPNDWDVDADARELGAVVLQGDDEEDEDEDVEEDEEEDDDDEQGLAFDSRLNANLEGSWTAASYTSSDNQSPPGLRDDRSASDKVATHEEDDTESTESPSVGVLQALHIGEDDEAETGIRASRTVSESRPAQRFGRRLDPTSTEIDDENDSDDEDDEDETDFLTPSIFGTVYDRYAESQSQSADFFYDPLFGEFEVRDTDGTVTASSKSGAVPSWETMGYDEPIAPLAVRSAAHKAAEAIEVSGNENEDRASLVRHLRGVLGFPESYRRLSDNMESFPSALEGEDDDDYEFEDTLPAVDNSQGDEEYLNDIRQLLNNFDSEEL